ncbi:MAG: molybdopterin converting factor small subunit [Haloarculaceae archaeon]|jgi:molybdopterin converting factor small subunit
MESKSQREKNDTSEPRRDEAGSASGQTETAVTVRCTGKVHAEVGQGQIEFTFDGDTLREFLEAFFESYDVSDMLIAETEADATTEGWAPEMEELPGRYAKNPEGEQTRCYARVAINGEFNELLAGLDTEITDGDRVSLLYPFIYCC